MHYGAPAYNTQRVFFNINRLKTEFAYTAEITVTFGGKKSPLKVSRYKLDFAGLGRLNFPLKQIPDNFVILREENIMQSEIGGNNKPSKEEIFNRILKY